jgi:hypothetical protein
MSEKSILEQALLQVQTLEEAVKQNAKGILASTMKQELNDLLKESMEEEEEVAEQPIPGEEEEDGMSDADADEADAEENDDETSINDEPFKDIDGDESEEDAEGEAEDEEPAMDDDFASMDDEDDMDSDDDMLDMTDASDEEVLKVFKAMSDEDGIVVKKDGNNIELKDEDDDYIIKLGDDAEESDEDFGADLSEEEFPAADDEVSDEEVYEIDLDEEDEDEMSDEPSEEEMGESARTFAFHKKGNGGTQFKAGSNGKNEAINEEVSKLKKQNAEYKKALVLFKDKLNEVAVFNANLAYATRLFTEHSTTKAEKLNILKRFDNITTITESKNLYNTIKTDLDTKNPVTESVANKIASTPSSSSSEVLSESKVYEAPQFSRMKELMKKMK